MQYFNYKNFSTGLYAIKHARLILNCISSNISNPTIRTGLELKSKQARTGPNSNDLESSPVPIGESGMTFQINELLIRLSQWTKIFLIQS